MRSSDLLNGEGVVFVKHFRHWRTGRIIYPKTARAIAIRIRKNTRISKRARIR